MHSKRDIMITNPKYPIQYNGEVINKIFKQKKYYHRKQAKLPIEDKVRILVELQKIALTIRPKKDNDDKRFVWKI